MVPTGPVIRRRIALCMAAFAILFSVLTFRLFNLQVVRAEDLQARGKAQWTSEAVIQPRRGFILDTNGDTLALSATSYTASVSPRRVKDARAFAKILAPVLDMDEQVIYERASDKSKGGVTLKRQLTRGVSQQLKLMLSQSAGGNNELDGLYLEQDSRRYYPYGAFATQLLGLTTVDGVGQAGLESSLNNYLSGKTGRIVTEIDGKGRTLDYTAGEYVSASDGSSVTLTLDKTIQGFCEKAAREAMSVNGAEGVRIIAMNPKTCEILAMVTKPDYDPNEPPRYDVSTLTELMRNRSIADSYEPGSTFKIITMSAILNERLSSLNEWFYCSGSIRVEGGKIRCWGNPHGSESLTQALENSCNPVFVELGLRLGTETFYNYLEAFGFGEKTGVDIPGEGGGILIPRSSVKRVDIARVGFGQSVAVTPIQLLTAACAVVNGGNLMKPYVVKEITDADGNVIERNEPTVVGHPITEETSRTMRMMLESVVANGGGKNAYIDGYHVGGKTGTAQVYVDGAVSTDTHIGSFIGFAPMDDPKIAVLVIVDRADRRPDFGSVTCAPFAKDILAQSLAYMGVAKDESAEETLETTVPDVTGMSLASAVKSVKAAGLKHMTDSNGTSVMSQLPEAGAQMSKGSVVMLYMADDSPAASDAFIPVPDITGMSIMQANSILAAYGLKMNASGSGLAVSQSPGIGEYVYPQAEICVEFIQPD